MTDSNPTGFQVWYRHSAPPRRWFPIHEEPLSRQYCEIGVQILGELAGIETVLILPSGVSPDDSRLNMVDPLTRRLHGDAAGE
jgi:hypothetical protein